MQIAHFLDEHRIHQWFFCHYHADGARCPHCGASLQNGTAAARNFWMLRRFVCPECRREGSIRGGTPLQTLAISYQDFFLIVCARECGLDPDQAARLTGKSPRYIKNFYTILDDWERFQGGGNA